MAWIQTNFTAESMNTGKVAKPVAVVKDEKPVAKKKAKVEAEVVAPVVEEAVVVADEPEVVEPEAE